ncbi:mRNA splicing protein [Actinomortierella wolfii]|nr:mRNA splicing protein [Actinomortierella wolfii]
MSQKLSREEYRKQKDLEAARKAGTAPAARDEEGREINPHIPQYIADAPWYINTGVPSLKHQRASSKRKESSINEEWYARGLKQGPSATKYRKGACENCGAMTHKTKDCVERPRKKGARWTGKDIQQDEVIQKVDLSFDAKRDRWNGYDPKEHDKIYEEYEKIEEARRKLKESELDKQDANAAAAMASKMEKQGTAAEFGDSDDDDDDEEKYAEKFDMPGQKVNAKTRTTIRNLRIREDRAKYLYNLDPNSAYYDPKTRSMRENPLKDQDPTGLNYAGDNFQRYSGDTSNVAKLQLFAWQSAEKGSDIHMQANPTQAEMLHRQFMEKKAQQQDSNKTSILAKYGGEEYLEAPARELLLSQTENYVEYSRSGRVIKGQEPAKAKSKYLEDVYINNHTSVWGSYWSEGQWGYKCCRSFLKNSYCTGTAGIEAQKISNSLLEKSKSSSPPPSSAQKSNAAASSSSSSSS